ncbi:MAG: hypothetical protein RLZZ84_440 [Pseudomonadota bacterium]|jgi:hypothetical protein
MMHAMRCHAVLLASAAIAVPTSAQASCTLVDQTVGLGQITSAIQLKDMQGEVINGALVRGSAPAVAIRLSNCSTTLTTTVRMDPVAMTLNGTTLTFAPWLVNIDGAALAGPKDLSQIGHDFVGNPTLGILLVPVSVPTNLVAGRYSGTTVFTFTD